MAASTDGPADLLACLCEQNPTLSELLGSGHLSPGQHTVVWYYGPRCVLTAHWVAALKNEQ